MYSSAVFTGGRPLCTQILRGLGCLPLTILGTRKLETLGYPTVKTRVSAFALVLTQYRHVTEDGRKDMPLQNFRRPVKTPKI